MRRTIVTTHRDSLTAIDASGAARPPQRGRGGPDAMLKGNASGDGPAPRIDGLNSPPMETSKTELES